MDKKALLCIAGLVILPCVAAAKHVNWNKAPHSRSIARWQAWYNDGAQFFDHKDFNRLSEVLSSDWKNIDSHGKVTMQGNDPDKMKAQMGSASRIRVNFRVLGVKRTADGYNVRTYSRFAMTMNGPDHKRHHIVQSGTSIDSWVRQDHKIVMTQTKALTEHNTMDGKPMPEGAM